MFEKMERQSRVNSDALASRLEGALSPGWRRPISPHRKLEPAAAYDMPEDALSPDMLRQIVLQGLASRLEDTSELVTSRKSNSKKLMQPPKPAQDAGGKSEVNTVVAKTTVIEMDGYCDMSDAHTPIVATTALGKAPGETEQLEWDSSDLVPECSQVVSQKNTRAVMPYAPSKSTSPRLLKRAPPPPPTTRLRPLPPTGNNSYLPIMGMPSTENATAADGYMPMGGGRLHMAQPPPPTMSVSLMAKPRNVVPTPPKQQLHLRAARDDKQGAMWA